jgi:integrase
LLWPYRPNRFGLHFERIVQAAGIRRGTFKWLRRSSGSYVAANHGEAAGAQHLGHTSLATFRRYYDARLVGRSRPMPPEL